MFACLFIVRPPTRQQQGRDAVSLTAKPSRPTSGAGGPPRGPTEAGASSHSAHPYPPQKLPNNQNQKFPGGEPADKARTRAPRQRPEHREVQPWRPHRKRKPCSRFPFPALQQRRRRHPASHQPPRQRHRTPTRPAPRPPRLQPRSLSRGPAPPQPPRAPQPPQVPPHPSTLAGACFFCPETPPITGQHLLFLQSSQLKVTSSWKPPPTSPSALILLHGALLWAHPVPTGCCPPSLRPAPGTRPGAGTWGRTCALRRRGAGTRKGPLRRGSSFCQGWGRREQANG